MAQSDAPMTKIDLDEEDNELSKKIVSDCNATSVDLSEALMALEDEGMTVVAHLYPEKELKKFRRNRTEVCRLGVMARDIKARLEARTASLAILDMQLHFSNVDDPDSQALLLDVRCQIRALFNEWKIATRKSTRAQAKMAKHLNDLMGRGDKDVK